MTKKKICFICPFCDGYLTGEKAYGGGELQVILLANMFTSFGHDVSIITKRLKSDIKYNNFQFNIIQTDFRFFDNQKKYLLIDLFRLCRIIYRIKADYYIIKVGDILLAPIGLMRIFRRKLRLVKIFASNDDLMPKSKIERFIYYIGISLTTDFVFQTQEERKIVNKNFKIDGVIIRNVFFPPFISENTPKNIDILWVGSFTYWKAPNKLLELIESMPERIFTIISKPCTDEKYSELEKKIKQSKNVNYLESIPITKINEYYAKSKILICTSVVEGFPNTFLMAWHYKTPVISLTFECDHILEDEGIGLVSKTIQQMKKDITLLLSNDSLRNKMGDKSFQYTQKHYPENIYRDFEELVFKK